MADERSDAERRIATFREGVNAIRDVSLMFGVLVIGVLFLRYPEAINDRLSKAGFTEGSLAGFKWEKQIAESSEQTKNAGQVISELEAKLSDYSQRLDELKAKTSEPVVRTSLAELATEVKSSQDIARSADKAVKDSLITQQRIIQQISPSTSETAGWVYLGKVTEDKTSWVAGSPETVMPTAPQIAAGTQLRVRDDVYLRGDVQTGSRSSGPVLSVVKAGNSVDVSDVDYSHARGGGWFVWAKVKPRTAG